MSRVKKWIKTHRTRISGVFVVICLLIARPTHNSLLYGLALILPGECIRVWSSGHIHKNQILTVTGPYSLSRNPLYVGSFILGTGFMVAMGVIWLAVAFLVIFAAVYWFTIKWEEDKLARTFPGGWEDYKRSVPRFLPFFRFPQYHPGEFSWVQTVKHRELLNALVVVAAYAFLWGKALLIGHG